MNIANKKKWQLTLPHGAKQVSHYSPNKMVLKKTP